MPFRRAGLIAAQRSATARLAGLLRHDGPWSEALTRHATALRAAQQLGDPLGQANVLTDLGRFRLLTDDFEGAARDLEEALSIYREIGNRSAEAEALNEAGTLYRIRGDLDRAGSCHQQALDLAREVGIAWDEAHALAGLGRCALPAGYPEQAVSQLGQTLEIFRRIGAAEGAEVAAELGVLAGTPDEASARS